MNTVIVRHARAADRSVVERFYQEAGYGTRVSEAATVFLAELSGELVGLVRLEPEQGVVVLRGMRVASAYQRQGIGTLLLRAVDEHLGTSYCYCVPYAHLSRFYGQIGFITLSPQDAPAFLLSRLIEYRDRGLDVLLMWRGHS